MEGKDVAKIFVKDNSGKEEEVREETDEVDRRDEKVINEVDEHNEGQIALLRLTRFLLRFGGEVER